MNNLPSCILYTAW